MPLKKTTDHSCEPFYQHSKNAKRVHVARDSRANWDWVLKETNMAAEWLKQKHVDFWCLQLDIIIDFKNSDLTSIGSFTHSSTPGVICGLNIHGRDMAEVLKNPTQVSWGMIVSLT